MKLAVNFNPGPSQLYFTVPDHIRQALREGIPSISHRSKTFEKIFAEAVENLRVLLNLPPSFRVLFCASATEIWERIIQNFSTQHTVHLSCGAFGQRFYETALQLGRQAVILSKPLGEGFIEAPAIPPTELIAVTHNETSTGVVTPPEVLRAIKKAHPKSILAVDAVSSLPHPELDYAHIDTVFFSVQKGFGLPAGLGVWLVNEACIERQEALQSQGHVTGSYHSLHTLLQHAAKNQTPETPNVLGIYLLAKVAADMLRRGITAIRRETDYKAAVLYNTLEQHPLVKPLVSQPSLRSPTVIVAQCDAHTAPIKEALHRHGMEAGEGYGALKTSTLRFANFPAHSKEQAEQLADVLMAFQAT
jgi:phosphoserine aminotransferase